MWATLLAVAKGLAALFGFGEKVTVEVHDANQQNAGATAQLAVDRAAEVRAEQNALEVANNSKPSNVTDSLRHGDF